MRATRAELRTVVVRGLQLLGLCELAFAQPLFDLLGRNPEFFVAHDSTPRGIVVFAAAVTLLPPAALLLAESLVGVAGRRYRAAAHFVLVALLAAVIALHALRRLNADAGFLVLGAALAGVGAAALFARAPAGRSFVTALAGAAPVFAALFLLHSPVSALVTFDSDEARASVAVSASAPVVLVIFDEFPVMSLLDERGRIDSRRFPAFGDLARHATWFRNTSAASDETLAAVPAILSGTYPSKGQLPIASDYPRNLFTLLGGRYRMQVYETVTHLCPRGLCAQTSAASYAAGTRVLASDVGIVYLHLLAPTRLEERLPTIGEGWANFAGADVDRAARRHVLATAFSSDRRARLTSFIEAIRRSPQPTLYFAHVLLPHRPWSYLPSGRQYGSAVAVLGTSSAIWPRDEWLITQAYRRYLLQLGFVDRMLGKLLAHLRATGLYDDSLIVVTADHGIAFRPGQPLRAVRQSNIADIAPVPLLVKAPHQRRGRVVDRPLQTIDILPTIADLLAIRLPWRLDGRSGLSPGAAGRRFARVVDAAGRSFRADTATLARRTRELAAAKVAVFGAHSGGRSLFDAGVRPELIGLPVKAASVAPQPAAALAARLGKDERAWLRSVDLRSAFVPANVLGVLRGPGSRPGLTLAVALNGRIAALTKSAKVRGQIKFEALVPESAFRNGANEVELFVVVEPHRTLERISFTG